MTDDAGHYVYSNGRTYTNQAETKRAISKPVSVKKRSMVKCAGMRQLPGNGPQYWYRIETKDTNTGETRHIQLEDDHHTIYGQNQNGSNHGKNDPNPPNSVIKRLKKYVGWDWNGNNDKSNIKMVTPSPTAVGVAAGIALTYWLVKGGARAYRFEY